VQVSQPFSEIEQAEETEVGMKIFCEFRVRLWTVPQSRGDLPSSTEYSYFVLVILPLVL
jgi:hypothetical protein